ncbi:MAG: hypothetical protein R3C10_26245 [Pirellulales bacterium]
MVLADGEGIPLAVDVDAANHAEVNLIEPLIDAAVTSHVPPRLIDDRAADSAPPERATRRARDRTDMPPSPRTRQATAADGRAFRRYRRR